MSIVVLTRLRGYEFAITPNQQQARLFVKTFGCVRKIYNLYVEEGRKRDAAAAAWHDEDPENRKDLEYPYKWKTNAQYKQEYPYLREADSLALSNARQAFFKARNNHFEKGTGKPRFKSKSDYPRSFTINNQNYKDGNRGTIYVYEDEQHPGKNYLHLPKLFPFEYKNGKEHPHGTGDVPIILHRKIKGDIHEATVKYLANGSWKVSLLIEEAIEIETSEDPGETADNLVRFFGGDLGLSCFLTGTDGISYDDPGDYAHLEAKLRREQRKLGKQAARLKKQGKDLRKCKNYQKQRRKVARIFAKIASKRRDFRHKLSRTIVNNHDVIVVEDLNVKGLMKNHCLARGISEAAWGDFVRMLKYKTEGDSKVFVKVGRYYPSTRRCCCCGEETGPKGFSGLSEREWECSHCGAVHARDENAAWNILLEGIRILSKEEDDEYWTGVLELLSEHVREMSLGACGEENSPSTVGTAGIAWGEASQEGIPDGDPSMNTERFNQACQVESGLGELGVSRKSLADVTEHSDCVKRT